MTTLNPAAITPANAQTHDTANWDAHYKSRIGESYPAYCRQQYRPFLDVLRGEMHSVIRQETHAVIREEGCGIGTITKILAQDFAPSQASFVAFDYDAKQVNNTRVNMHSLIDHDVTIYKGDHFEMQGVVDIIHGHGVLEHFSDEEIIKAVTRQQKEARYAVIHYVPLEGWGSGSYGDERLLSADYWRTILGADSVRTFNGGRDAICVWKGYGRR